MRKFISNKFTLFALGILFVIALWIILSLCFDTNGGIFPSPINTFARFTEQPLYDFLKPLMTVIKSIPTVALVFLFVVLLTPKDAPILVVIVICFPILYEAVANGIRKVDPQVVQAARVDGARYFKRVLVIKLPLAISYVIVGVVSSFSLSFKIEIMAEVITGTTSHGLGSVIHFVQQEDPTELTSVFAYSLFAIIFMLLFTLLEQIIKQVLIKQKD